MSMAAYIAEGRLAPANGRNPGRQDRRAAPVCSFVVPKMGPKTGRNIAGRRKGFQNGGPVSVRNLSFVLLAMGLTKPDPSFTVWVVCLFPQTVCPH